MIYTATFNPSLDYIVTVDNFQVGKVNRTTSELMFPGGKGINVSIVLKNLGMESTILGFTAGFIGAEIRRRLAAIGCQEELIPIANGCSRINLKLRSNEESEINGMGPVIDETAIRTLYAKLDTLQSGDALVLAGSIPTSMPDTVYSDILKSLEGHGVLTVVDATKDLLVNALPYHPFLIKPNNHELGEIFGRTLTEKKDVLVCAQKLQERGARNVLVSMAGDGAVLAAENGEIYESPAPKGKVVNSVGAGDSMVAGFLYGYLNSRSYRNAFKTGIAAGSASAFSEKLATRKEVDAIFTTLTI